MRVLGAASNSATSIFSARSPFQKPMARRRASRASISLSGATSAISRAVSSSSSAGASSSSTRWCMAVRPCFSALREARALPSSVRSARAGAVAARGFDLGGGAGCGHDGRPAGGEIYPADSMNPNMILQIREAGLQQMARG